MKTKYISKTIAVGVIFSLWGCTDFLTENPKDDLYAEQIYANESSAYVGLIGCYENILHGKYHNKNFQETLFPNSVFCATGTDPLATGLGSANQDIVDLFNFRQTSTMSCIADLFQGVYEAITPINNFIDNIEKADFSENAKARYIGEARFLRAKVYFDIIRIWGKCPLSLSVSESFEDDHKPMASADAVFKAIEEDLIYAFDNMPKKAEQKYGFPFNMAAKAYLAKLYAQMATSEHFFIGSEDPYTEADRAGFWEKSYQAAYEVYTAPADNRYDLLPNYQDLWRCRMENTQESIFELNYNVTAQGNGWVQGTIPLDGIFTPKYNASGKNTRTRPSVVMYEWHREKYSDETDQDPRLNEYVVSSYQMNTPDKKGQIQYKTVYPDEVLGKNENKNPYYERFPIVLKYADPDFTSGNTTNANLILYRYADLLLVLAEAALESGKPRAEVLGYVNQVLQRARNSYGGGHTQPADWELNDFASDDELRLAIMKERLCELFVEGHEWFDVRRRGVEWFRYITTLYNEATETYRKPVDTNLAGYDRIVKIPNQVVDGIDMARKNLFMPIPQEEIADNTQLSAEDQNYGY